MSRIGKLPIALPQGVTTTITQDSIEVKGPKGTLSRSIHPQIQVEVASGELKITPRNPEAPFARALWGLFRSLINNMVTGVTAGFTKTLEVQGVGWKMEEEAPGVLRLSLGYSHPIIYTVPQGVSAQVDTRAGRVTLSSIDKELLGQTSATIRAFRPPEPYKGKGIRYQGEVVRHKVGKSGAK
ncbi:MAG: 50S ribosomal protein L6 [Deltaproteobacteria bacterium]|jgi:large subunit ribosomal protein L6|nr:50S ribosomal protein L6 [Deltaproteobacteria bacterium]